jgi:hypothetical protein
MKPKMSAAQREARRKAGLSTSNPTHACSGAISNAKPDCEEKRDPDKRSLIIQKKENELDLDTQLEKRALVAAEPFCHSGQSRRSTSTKRNAAFHYRKLLLRFFPSSPFGPPAIKSATCAIARVGESPGGTAM